MKKLILTAAALVALASCGNKTKGGDVVADSTEYNPTDTTAVATADGIEAAADSVTKVLSEQLSAENAKDLQATMQSVKEKYEALVKAGKTEEAAAYASKVKAYVTEHADELKKAANGNTTISDVIDGIVNLPTNAQQAAADAANAVNSDANAAANAASSAVTNAKNAGKQAVKDAENSAKKAVSDAKKKAKDDAKAAVDNAKQQTRDAANKAVNNALNKVLGN